MRLIQERKRILVLTGDGISESEHPFVAMLHCNPLTGVSCGIPDFRSKHGLYASLQDSGEYDLDDPQQM